MAASMNFRTAFNGFNREDVVNYIEYLTARHTAELNQLRTEIEYLQGKQPAAAPAPDDREALLAQIAALEEKCAQLEEQITAPTPQFSEAQELEAYRRAERAERLAQERAALAEQVAKENADQIRRAAKEYAAQLYDQANGALADATAKVDAASSQLDAITEAVLTQLNQLQTAVSGNKLALKDAAAIMYAIRPKNEQ